MSTPYLDELLDHLSAMHTRDDLAQALGGLLTPTELSEIAKRLQILRMLEAGVPQREIARELNVGIATVSRGSRALKSEQAS